MFFKIQEGTETHSKLKEYLDMRSKAIKQLTEQVQPFTNAKIKNVTWQGMAGRIFEVTGVILEEGEAGEGWKLNPNHPNWWVPNKRSKKGKEILKVISHLQNVDIGHIHVFNALGVEVKDQMSLGCPGVYRREGCILIENLEKWQYPKNPDIIEITSVEFYNLKGEQETGGD